MSSTSTEGGASWSVMAMTIEPLPILEVFVRFYLSRGASQVVLYFDREQLSKAEEVRKIPGCKVVICDEAFWKSTSRKRRPPYSPKRQLEVNYDAISNADTDWILFCDPDEFVLTDHRIGDVLSEVPTAYDTVWMPMLEHATVEGQDPTDPYGQWFRSQFRDPKWIGREIFGPLIDMSLGGITGHSRGKSFVRTGRGLIPGVHIARLPQDARRKARQLQLPQLSLLHFDHFTEFQWLTKLRRCIEWGNTYKVRDKRIKMFKKVLGSAPKVSELVAYFETVKTVDETMASKLARLGYLQAVNHGIQPALLEAGMEIPKVQTLDLALIEDQPELADFYGEWAEFKSCGSAEASAVSVTLID